MLDLTALLASSNFRGYAIPFGLLLCAPCAVIALGLSVWLRHRLWNKLSRFMAALSLLSTYIAAAVFDSEAFYHPEERPLVHKLHLACIPIAIVSCWFLFRRRPSGTPIVEIMGDSDDPE